MNEINGNSGHPFLHNSAPLNGAPQEFEYEHTLGDIPEPATEEEIREMNEGRLMSTEGEKLREFRNVFDHTAPEPNLPLVPCDAHLRPFVPINGTQVDCLRALPHTRHRGELLNYAYPGSRTIMEWFDDDRRNFRGEYPGLCGINCLPTPAIFDPCILPSGHRGGHVA